MKRNEALKAIEFVAYRDGEFAVRIYADNRISYEKARESFSRGINFRNADISCGQFPRISNEFDRKKAIESLQ